MKVLHTSDWHLGRSLYLKKRYEEYESFLQWLAETIENEEADVLLIAGDLFDSSTPSNRAQELYYRFLCRIAGSSCRHVVITAGNHDSPSFLNAPRELLKALNIHVVANLPDDPAEEVLTLKNREGVPELIVCAVPYLRDKEIRKTEARESISDKEKKLLEGIRDHYSEAGKIAEQEREGAGGEIPLIVMGHLFTTGGETVEGDGVRELYVGSLVHVSTAVFPQNADYVALGHLHIPQRAGNSDFIRYSGSPLPVGFGEARQEKSVCLIEFVKRKPSVQLITIPRFQALQRIAGNLESILQRITELALSEENVWLEIVYDGDEIIGDLRRQLEEAVSGRGIEILRVKNNRIINKVLSQTDDESTLNDLDIHDVFEQCLTAHSVPEEQHSELKAAYREIVKDMQEEDSRAE